MESVDNGLRVYFVGRFDVETFSKRVCDILLINSGEKKSNSTLVFEVSSSINQTKIDTKIILKRNKTKCI